MAATTIILMFRPSLPTIDARVHFARYLLRTSLLLIDVFGNYLPTDAVFDRQPMENRHWALSHFDEPCLSGFHPHPLNVGCTHSPE